MNSYDLTNLRSSFKVDFSFLVSHGPILEVLRLYHLGYIYSFTLFHSKYIVHINLFDIT